MKIIISYVQRRGLQPSQGSGAATGGNNVGLRPRKDYGKLLLSLPFGYAIIVIIKKAMMGDFDPAKIMANYVFHCLLGKRVHTHAHAHTHAHTRTRARTHTR